MFSNGEGLISDSRLIEDLVQVTQVHEDSDIEVYRSAGGDPVVLAVGQDGRIRQLASTADAPAGWSESVIPTEFLVERLSVVGHGETAYLFAQARNAATPQFFGKRAGESCWSALAIDDEMAGQTVQEIKALMLHGEPMLFAFVQGATSRPGQFRELALFGGRLVGTAVDWASLGTTETTEVARLQVPWIHPDDGVCFFQDGGVVFRYGPLLSQQRVLIESSDHEQLASARTPEGDVLFLGRQGRLAEPVFTSIRVSTPDLAQQIIDTGSPCAQIAAMDAHHGGLSPAMVFVLDDAGHVKVSRLVGDRWEPLFPVAGALADLAPVVDDLGMLSVFGVDGARRLSRLFLSERPADGAGVWAREVIEIAGREVLQVPMLATDIELRGQGGAPMAGHEIELRADSFSQGLVNGASQSFGPGTPLRLRTDGAGRIRLRTRCHHLGLPDLQLTDPGTGQSWTVPRNERLKEALANWTRADVAAVLPMARPSDADGIIQAIRNVLGLFPHSPVGGAAMLEAVPSTWSLAIDSRGIQYTPHAIVPRQAATRHEVHPVRLDAQRSWAWLGDILSSVIEATASVVKLTIDHATLLIEALVDGVKYLFVGALDRLAQGLELVYAVLRSAGGEAVEIVRAFAWNFSDLAPEVSRTASHLEQNLRLAASGVPLKVAGFRKAVVTRFADWRSEVGGAFDRVISATPERLLWGGGDGPPHARKAADLLDVIPFLRTNRVIADWLLNQWFDYLSDSQQDPSKTIDFGSEWAARWAAFLSKVEATTSAALRHAMDDAARFFNGSASTPDALAAQTVKAILSALKNAVMLALDLLSVVLAEMLSLLEEAVAEFGRLLELPLENPLLEALCQLFAPPGSPRQATMSRLFCLIIALPGTLVFKAVMGHAPFEPHRPRHAASSPTEAETAAWTSVFVGGVATVAAWNVIEVVGDVGKSLPDKGRAFLGWNAGANLALPFAIWSCNWSTALNPPQTEPGATELITWSLYGGPLAITLVSLLATKGTKLPTASPVGTGLYSAMGLAMLASGIASYAREIEHKTAGPQMLPLNLLAPLPTAAKFLAFSKHPYAMAALLAIDVTSNTAAGVAAISLARERLQWR